MHIDGQIFDDTNRQLKVSNYKFYCGVNFLKDTHQKNSTDVLSLFHDVKKHDMERGLHKLTKKVR